MTERVVERLTEAPSASADTASAPGQNVGFSFGTNWKKFLARLDASHIAHARHSFTAFTGLASLEGQTFVDVGCGSGLSSLVAHQLGARTVVSVDIDAHCVSCAEQLRARLADNPAAWQIAQGSVLDRRFLSSLGQFSYVYSWGVLHHTGAMWSALENVCQSVEPGGTLHVAIYNEHKHSPAWHQVKRLCNRWPRTVFPVLKASYVLLILARLFARLESPLDFTRQYRTSRGMDFWRDVDDWLGGLPYEYCKPDQVIEFLMARGFALRRLKTSGSTGCNEFLFAAPRDDQWQRLCGS